MHIFEKTDYQKSHLIILLENEDSKYYASVNAEFARVEDGIENTGTWFVFLLHPVNGSCTFTLEKDSSLNDTWIPMEEPTWLEQDTINIITKEIDIFLKQ
ncbi:MAG: hypothetical protein ABI091_28400 [Ferruginibacter sp.]